MLVDMTMIVTIGFTRTGEQQVRGLMKIGTENAQVLRLFLQAWCDRGLDMAQSPFKTRSKMDNVFPDIILFIEFIAAQEINGQRKLWMWRNIKPGNKGKIIQLKIVFCVKKRLTTPFNLLKAL